MDWPSPRDLNKDIFGVFYSEQMFWFDYKYVDVIPYSSVVERYFKYILLRFPCIRRMIPYFRNEVSGRHDCLPDIMKNTHSIFIFAVGA